MKKYIKLSDYLNEYLVEFQISSLEDLADLSSYYVIFQGEGFGYKHAIVSMSVDEFLNRDNVKVVKAPEGYIVISSFDGWVLKWDLSEVFLHLKYDYDEPRDVWYSDLRAYFTIQDALKSIAE